MEDDTVTESMREVETEKVFISECDTYNGKVEVEHIDIKEEHSADINENRTDDEVVPDISLNPTCVNSSTQPNHLALFKCGCTLHSSTVIEVSGTSTPEHCFNSKETNPDAFAKKQSVTFPGPSEETEHLKDPIGVDFDSDRILKRVKVECNSCEIPVAFEEEVFPETTHGCDIFSDSVKEEIIDIKEECSADINSDNPEKKIISRNRNTFHRSNYCNTSSVFEVSGTSVPEICSNGGGKVADLFVEKELVIFPASCGETNTLRDIVEAVNTEINSCNISIADNRETLRACDTHSDSVKDESIDIKEECSEDNPENEIPNNRSSNRMDRSPFYLRRSTNETIPATNSPTTLLSKVTCTRIRLFQCNFCGKLFSSVYLLKRHTRAHKTVSLFSHKFCGKTYSQKHSLLNHGSIHTNVPSYSCDICKKKFFWKGKLTRGKHHCASRQKPDELKDTEFSCDFCGKSFSYKCNLSRHINMHLRPAQQFRCSVCGKQFSRIKAFLRHEIIHKTVDSFSCKFCKKRFVYKHSLESHENSHSADQLFNCNICGKSIPGKNQFSRHVKMHTGIRSFFCKVCKKCFSDRSSLVGHEKLHSIVPPFSCSTCGKPSFKKSEFLRHERTHTGVRPFCCKVCKKYFTDKSYLTFHERMHSGVRTFICSTCGKLFYRKSELTRHESIHAESKLFSCDTCGKCFITKRYLVTHVKIHQ